MARAGLTKDRIVRKAAELANEVGLEKVTFKMLADSFHVQPPSLYNHIEGIEALQKEIMLFGWREMDEKMTQAALCVSGYDALEAICHAFYQYATDNPGVFNAMLWYNKFQDDEAQEATKKIFSMIYKDFSTLNIAKNICDHLIRTFRSFLEGFALLVNNRAFGNPVTIEKSFEISLQVLIAGTKTFEGKEDADE